MNFRGMLPNNDQRLIIWMGLSSIRWILIAPCRRGTDRKYILSGMTNMTFAQKNLIINGNQLWWKLHSVHVSLHWLCFPCYADYQNIAGRITNFISKNVIICLPSTCHIVSKAKQNWFVFSWTMNHVFLSQDEHSLMKN